MWNSDAQLDKYLYARTNPHKIKIIAIMGLLATVYMTYGFTNYLKLGLLNSLIFGPLICIFLLNKYLRFFMQLFYPKFDIKKHEKFVSDFWLKNSEPSVDVFLPWAGEDLKIHEEVLKAVSNLDYKNIKVYMLDDAGSGEHKKLSEKYGFKYLSRPNKGEFKKSGNLQYGYDHARGEFIFVLDADFIPTKNSLKDIIPYIVSDRKIGILQTPQYFEQTKNLHEKSAIEFGGGNIVEDFYKVVMPCRDEFKAAMCVGTSAVYRKSAINKLSGTPKVHASEDLATGLLVTNNGYYVKYLPLIISIGKSPETYQGYFKQHLRWCSGNLVFADYWPKAKLSLAARLTYLTNPLYYLSEAASVIFPFHLLYLLKFHAETLSINNMLYFIPYLLLSRIIIPLSKTNKSKIGTKLAARSNAYTYFYTYIRMLTTGIPAWHPTGVKIKGLHEDFMNGINTGSIFSLLFLSLLFVILITNPSIFTNFHTYPVLGWSLYTAYWHTLFLTTVLVHIHPQREEYSTSPVGKAFLYIKTHSILSVFLLLVSLVAFNFVISASNPFAPTALAVSAFRKQDSTKEGIKFAGSLNNSANVLAASTKAGNEPFFYTYEMSSDNSLEDISQKAVISYTEKHALALTSGQIETAAKIIADNAYGNEVRAGDLVTFYTDTIATAVVLATKRD